MLAGILRLRVRFSLMGEGRSEQKGLTLLRGLLRHYPFVLKNFKHYFQNLYRREIRRRRFFT